MAHFDLIVIGGGSGGVACARRAGGYGARVALCEDNRVGGTCVIRGCIPKKLMRYGAVFAAHFRAARGYGWEVVARLDWSALDRGARSRDRRPRQRPRRRRRHLRARLHPCRRPRHGPRGRAACARCSICARNTTTWTTSWPPRWLGTQIAIRSRQLIHGS